MWSLLCNTADWVAYQRSSSEQMGAPASLCSWGRGPRAYPCLMMSYLQPPAHASGQHRVLSAYVYVADAERLLQATKPASVLAAVAADPDAPKVPNQAQFDRWVAGELLAIVQLLIDTKICTQEQFEERLIAALEFADEQHASNVESYRRLLAEYAKKNLDLDGGSG